MTLAVNVCRWVAGMQFGEIAKLFGGAGYSTVSNAIGRTKGELAEER